MLMKGHKTAMHITGNLLYWHFSHTEAYTPLQFSQ